MTTEIIDNSEERRFEMNVEGKTAFVNYQIKGKSYLLTHAEVPSELNGQGYGSKLARGVYEAIKDKGMRATPICSFMVQYAKRHPELQSLIDE